MELLEAIIMGTLQGVTEFLPVSSSGHLRLAEYVAGTEEPDLLFDVLLHVGTLIAVCIVYRQDLWTIVKGVGAGLKALLVERSLGAAVSFEGVRLLLLIVIASVPTALIGLGLKDLIQGPMFNLATVGGLLILNGGILLGSRWVTRGEEEEEEDEEEAEQEGLTLWRISVLKALAIGVVQGIAVLPGISRSGLTITLALILGVRRQQAARYSFLLSIPAILGALVLSLKDADLAAATSSQWLAYGLGALAAIGVGYVCLLLLMQLLKRAQFHHFAWYCFAVGTLAVVWHFWG